MSSTLHAHDRQPEVTYSSIEGAGNVPLLIAQGGNREGPTILFIHGMAKSHLCWDGQFQSDLARDFRLVAFDLRGHGGSAKPWEQADYAGSQIWADDLAAVIKALDLDQVTIAAWSFGGLIAVSYLRHFGASKVKALNLVGTTGGLLNAPPPKSNDFEGIIEKFRKRASLSLRENIEGYADKDNLTAEPLAPEDERDSLLTGVMHPSYVRRVLNDLPLMNEDMVVELKLPVLLSIGTVDIGMTADTGRQLAAQLRDGRISIYDELGHFPAYEDAARYNAELREFAK